MVLEKEASIKNTELEKSDKYFLELFSNPKDKKQIVDYLLTHNQYYSYLFNDIIANNKDLEVNDNNRGYNNINPDITKNSILSPILTNLASSFYLKPFNLLLHSYYDYTCCGIRHFGHVNRVPYAGPLKETVNSFYEKVKDSFIDIDKLILLDLISRYNTFYLKSISLRKLDLKKKLKIIKQELKEHSKDPNYLNRNIITRSTVGTLFAQNNIDIIKNYSTEQLLEQWFKGEYINNQTMLFTYLHNSKLFKEKNRFINANSGNVVLEYEFVFDTKSYINQFLELLESYEE